MAETTHDVNARRSAALLRCQAVRERRQRLETLRAEHALAEAVAQERAARDALDASRAAATTASAAGHAGLQGRVVGIREIESLGALEQDLVRDMASCADRLAAAEAGRRDAQAASDAAFQALRDQARRTAKRARFAELAESRRRRALESAQEIERDDQVAEMRRPA